MKSRSEPSREERDGQGGMALVVALLALVALSAVATAGLWSSSSTFRSSVAFSDGSRAFLAAQTGLQEFVGTHGISPPSSAAYDFGAGERASVTAVAVRRNPDVYHLRSIGTLEEDGQVVARRTVGATATVNMGPLPAPPASLFSPGGVMKTGGQGVLSGMDRFDEGNPGQCPYRESDDTYGVVVSQSGRYRGNPNVPKGDPAGILEADRDQMLADLGLDWQGVLDGTAVQPDVDLTGGGDDGASWPNFDTIPAEEWLLVQAGEQDETLDLDGGESGHGLLVAEGDLMLTGGFQWDGVLYVGGSVSTGSGMQRVDGALLTGLNTLVDAPPDDADRLDGPVSLRYHSCHVRQARGSASHLEIVAGTWYEGEDGGAP